VQVKNEKIVILLIAFTMLLDRYQKFRSGLSNCCKVYDKTV
jgi:hypothetical protein